MIWCKQCVVNQYDEYFHKYNGDLKKSLWHTCQKFDIPFLEDKFNMTLTHINKKEHGVDSAIGFYLSKLNIKADEISNITCFDDGITSLEIINYSDGEIEQNDEEMFGVGYSPEEYLAFRKKYNFLKNNYPEKTALHTEALIRYIRYSCKEELAMVGVNADPKKAEGWAKLAKDAATAAKINPSQLSQADLQGGLNSIAEIAKAAEEQFDIIQILPEFKYRPNDAADFIIWCYINYGRKAKGLPIVDYSDVYKFYDDKKQEYIEQTGDPYGIFENDPTEKNRMKVEKFIDVPKARDD